MESYTEPIRDSRWLAPAGTGPGFALCLGQLWLNLGHLLAEPCQLHGEPEPWSWMRAALSPAADFGVSGELTASVAKRRSFIGAPYW